MFVDTEAYDTARNRVVNNFFSSLILWSHIGSNSHCGADGDSDGAFDAGPFLEPGNFTRTDLLAESSYRVPAGEPPGAVPLFLLSPT